MLDNVESSELSRCRQYRKKLANGTCIKFVYTHYPIYRMISAISLTVKFATTGSSLSTLLELHVFQTTVRENSNHYVLRKPKTKNCGVNKSIIVSSFYTTKSGQKTYMNAICICIILHDIHVIYSMPLQTKYRYKNNYQKFHNLNAIVYIMRVSSKAAYRCYVKHFT